MVKVYRILYFLLYFHVGYKLNLLLLRYVHSALFYCTAHGAGFDAFYLFIYNVAV